MNCRNLVVGSCAWMTVAAALFAQEDPVRVPFLGPPSADAAPMTASGIAREDAVVDFGGGRFVANHWESVSSGILDDATPEERKDWQKLNQKDHQLQTITQELLASLSEATDAKRSEMDRKLRDVVTEHFEVKQKLRGLELVQLEKRVRRLRELHDRRDAAKNSIVAKRLEQLSDEAKGLGWTVSSRARTRRGVPVHNSADVLIWNELELEHATENE